MTKTINIPRMPAGGDQKFRVTTTKEDFQLSEDAFFIIIKNRYGRVVQRILKNDCFYDTEGRWYFTAENIKEGEHLAVFVGQYEDDDYDKQHRTFIDIQPLYVGTAGCDAVATSQHACAGHSIQYEQVWSVSIDGEDYLADSLGRYIYTSDGKRIQFTNQLSNDVEDMGKVKMQMTGEEFLKMWEQRDPNSEVNTIPEMMDVMRGISDDETIPQKIQEEIDENDQENEASDADIDSIFEPDVQTGGSGGFPDEMQVEEGD